MRTIRKNVASAEKKQIDERPFRAKSTIWIEFKKGEEPDESVLKAVLQEVIRTTNPWITVGKEEDGELTFEPSNHHATYDIYRYTFYHMVKRKQIRAYQIFMDRCSREFVQREIAPVHRIFCQLELMMDFGAYSDYCLG